MRGRHERKSAFPVAAKPSAEATWRPKGALPGVGQTVCLTGKRSRTTSGSKRDAKRFRIDRLATLPWKGVCVEKLPKVDGAKETKAKMGSLTPASTVGMPGSSDKGGEICRQDSSLTGGKPLKRKPLTRAKIPPQSLREQVWSSAKHPSGTPRPEQGVPVSDQPTEMSLCSLLVSQTLLNIDNNRLSSCLAMTRSSREQCASNNYFSNSSGHSCQCAARPPRKFQGDRCQCGASQKKVIRQPQIVPKEVNQCRLGYLSPPGPPREFYFCNVQKPTGVGCQCNNRQPAYPHHQHHPSHCLPLHCLPYRCTEPSSGGCLTSCCECQCLSRDPSCAVWERKLKAYKVGSTTVCQPLKFRPHGCCPRRCRDPNTQPSFDFSWVDPNLQSDSSSSWLSGSSSSMSEDACDCDSLTGLTFGSFGSSFEDSPPDPWSLCACPGMQSESKPRESRGSSRPRSLSRKVRQYRWG